MRVYVFKVLKRGLTLKGEKLMVEKTGVFSGRREAVGQHGRLGGWRTQ